MKHKTKHLCSKCKIDIDHCCRIMDLTKYSYECHIKAMLCPSCYRIYMPMNIKYYKCPKCKFKGEMSEFFPGSLSGIENGVICPKCKILCKEVKRGKK